MDQQAWVQPLVKIFIKLSCSLFLGVSVHTLIITVRNILSDYLIVTDAFFSPENKTRVTIKQVQLFGTKQAVNAKQWDHLVACLCNCMWCYSLLQTGSSKQKTLSPGAKFRP